MNMGSILDYTAMLVIAACLVITGIRGAAIEDRFLPHFTTSDASSTAASSANATSSAAVSGHAVNASPVLVSQGSRGKKIQITITKEIPVHPVHGHGGAHGGNATATHAGHHHNMGQAAPAQLHLTNSPALVVDNETMADLLQQLLAGNLQNVQKNGRPLAVPPGGKPVAVIFSSSVHVVDLGDLRPPTTPAPVTARPHTHAPHVQHNATGHNFTHSPHHGLNHTSLLESIISPLISLTHLGHSTPVQHPPHTTATVAASSVQPVQMQPVVMMVPVSQLQGVPLSQIQGVSSSASVMSSGASAPDSSAQLSDVLQGILAAKQQLINSTLLAGHESTHPGHQTHVSGAHSSATQPVISANLSTQSSGDGSPSVGISKKVDISI